MRKPKSHIAALLCSAVIATFAQGAGLEYDAESPVRLGSTFNISYPAEPTANCFSYVASEVNPKWVDGGGNVVIDMSLATTYEKLSRLVGYDVVYNSKASASYGVVSGSGSTEFGASFTDFRENESNHIGIVIRAVADYGRYEIVNGDLAEEYKALAADSSKASDFIAKCGTHVARNERRGQILAIVLEASNLNAVTKRWIEAKYASTFGAKVGMESLKAEGSSSISLTFKSFSELLNRTGRTQLKIVANGVSDTAALGPAISALNATDLNALLQKLEQLAAGFNRNASKPLRYGFAPLTLYGGPDTAFPEENRETLSELYLRLSKVNADMGRIEKVLGGLPKESNIDFRSYYSEELRRRRELQASIGKHIVNCLAGPPSPCELPAAESGIYWPSDALVDLRSKAECVYYVPPTAPSGQGPQSGAPVQSITIMLRGLARGPYDWFDLQPKAFYLDTALNERPVSASLIGTKMRLSDVVTDPDMQVEYGAATRELKFQVDFLPLVKDADSVDREKHAKAYEEAKTRVYGVQLTYRGEPMSFVVGRADFAKCPMTMD